MPRPKRTFANIAQLPSKWWQVKYTGPDGIRRYAPHTFDTRLAAEAFVVTTRRKIDRDQWDATDDNPREAVTFGVYAARWLENRQVAGKTDQEPHKRALRRHPGRPPTADVRQPAQDRASDVVDIGNMRAARGAIQ